MAEDKVKKQKILKEDLIEAYSAVRDEKNRDWNRVLPFSECFVDRWEKAEYLGFGQGTNIYDSSVVLGDVRVGKDTWIGPFTMLDGTCGTLKIGDHCSIATGCHIYTHDTVKYCLTGGIHPKEGDDVSIGDNCYIGPGVIISRGVTLGKCCVVGAHSFVNKSYEDYSVIAGIPAKQIGEVQITGQGEVHLNYFPKNFPGGGISRIRIWGMAA